MKNIRSTLLGGLALLVISNVVGAAEVTELPGRSEDFACQVATGDDSMALLADENSLKEFGPSVDVYSLQFRLFENSNGKIEIKVFDGEQAEKVEAELGAIAQHKGFIPFLSPFLAKRRFETIAARLSREILEVQVRIKSGVENLGEVSQMTFVFGDDLNEVLSERPLQMAVIDLSGQSETSHHISRSVPYVDHSGRERLTTITLSCGLSH